MLKDCEKRAAKLREEIRKASIAGDKVSLKKFQKELISTEKTMNQLRGSTATAEQVMRRLDKASPKELNKALREMKTQLNGMQRGSEAWNAQLQKIRMLKAEIQKVNSAMAVQQTGWQKMNKWLNNCQTAIMGIAAAVTGLVMAGRKAVNAYAEMDEQLANTRKYTGMTSEEVNNLNKAFLKMDTRTPREKLNELAQEAGRLGMNTLESVKGYVEAADIINVALVDLGEGATQTIAKLTNIFGVQELLGTKQSMLAVGSAVNVLSQNCTASKPYLVEFAQRMAGIGSQAGLTIPQILAFGAVLDANGQKVEMSSTAIQKVIMNLANKNHEFAATVGLDAQKLNETLKHSAKDGLIMFLEALQKMGQSVGFENATMTLAPAFKEMGLDAARVSMVLSTLAMHLDEVKWQMGEAEKAFNEASSATHEYEIFNSTAQASIDKARKRVQELAIELGEKLYPIMKHIYTSSGLFLRILNQVVSFFIQYKKEIIATTLALIAYKGAMLAHQAVTFLAANTTLVAAKATKLWHAALNLFGGVIATAKLAIAGLTNVVQYFTNGLKVNYDMQKRWRDSLSRMNFSSWVGLVLAVATAIYVLTTRMRDNRKAAEEAATKAKLLRDSIRDVDSAANEYTAKELSRLEQLYKAATNEYKSRDERTRAARTLQKLYPDIFANMDTETIMLGRSKEAYDNLRESIIKTARARAAAEKIQENEGKRLDLDSDKRKIDEVWKERGFAYIRAREDQDRANNAEEYRKAGLRAYQLGVIPEEQWITINDPDKPGEKLVIKHLDKLLEYRNRIKEQSKAISEANQELALEYDIVKGLDDKIGDIDPADYGNGNGSNTEASKEDKFKTEKEWRDREEALARIAYAKGESNFVEYTDRMNEIAVAYYKMMLDHTDLGEDERIKILADYWESKNKEESYWNSLSLESENKSHDRRIATLKQFYIDGKITTETYEQKIEEEEIFHQRALVAIAEEGSKDRLEAEAKLSDLLIRQMERRRAEAEKKEKEFSKIKDEYFGLNANEIKDKMSAELEALDVVYERELAAAGANATEKLRIEKAYQAARVAIQKKYNAQLYSDNKNVIEEFSGWLDSDGGKAMLESMSTITAGMSSIFSQLNSLMQADLEITTAKIEKKYGREIELAEGNSYRVAKLEKEKEKEIAQAKNEANRKMFAMQVIQAVAQTATNALNAYGSAAAVPVVGYILAPIAAAMAVAAGAIQIAAIKKQQQASEAQGYSEGGFTPQGPRDQAVGVVHAGEWVASQALVNSPVARPMIEALEYAQRNNRIGSLTMKEVSRSVMAPVIASSGSSLAAPQIVNVAVPQNDVALSAMASLEYVISKLNKQLEYPITAVTTITGDNGIKKAQTGYDRLIKNKSPKYK